MYMGGVLVVCYPIGKWNLVIFELFLVLVWIVSLSSIVGSFVNVYRLVVC